MAVTLFRGDFRGTDRFEVERRLGEGGFGVVYQVFDHERNERVALKTLQQLDAEALYRFKREFRLLSHVANPRLITLHELFSDGDTWFFTMDLVNGTDFLSYVLGSEVGEGMTSGVDAYRETPPLGVDVSHAGVADESRLRWALSELASGVTVLHESDRLHRDIKPSNVLVTDDDRLVLLDFGLATEAGIELSTVDQLVGTVAYMAPEQAGGDELTEATDWYAVGVMLYEALTGRLPHSGRELSVLVAKQERDPPPPVELAPTAPADLSELAMRLLARDPRDRASGVDIHFVLGDVASPRSVREAPSSWCDELIGDVLIGRHGEMEALGEAKAAVGRGKPVVAEVSGRSGMGKTALIESFARRLKRRPDVVVLAGRCYKQESVPFKAVDSVVDALCRYLRGLDLATANALMPRNVRALARLFPVLERVAAVRQAPLGAAEVPDSRELRQRAIAALAELLARIADRQPLVVMIDDLQWGDVDSAVLLGKLLADADPPGMLLVLSYRSEERGRSPFLKELLDGAALPAQVRRVEVAALRDDDAAELASLLLGEAATKERVETIVAESGGNPLFINALSQHTETGGVTFEALIATMVSELSPEPRRLLEVVAVAGQPVEPLVALRAARLEGEGMSPLATLRAARLVTSCGGDVDHLECYHDRVREAVVSEIGRDRLTEHHRALTEALQASGGDDPERMAFHLLGAGELTLGAQMAERAAEHASAKLAFERAARLFRTALDHGTLDDHRRRELQVKLGDALANAGRGGEAAAEYLTAADGLPRLEALELRRRAALQLLGSGRFNRGAEVMQEVLAELGMKPARTTRAAFLSIMVQQARLRARGYSFTEKSEREIPAEDLLSLDTCWAAAQGFRMTEVTRAMTFASRFLHLALDRGEPYRISLGLSLQATSIVAFSLSPKMQRRAAELLEQADALARRLDNPSAIAFNHFSAGVVAVFCGRWRVALERCDQAIELYKERCTGVTLELAQTQLFAITALLFLGRIHEISRRFFGLHQEARARGDLFSFVGYLSAYGFIAWLAEDDVDTARRELRQARAAWPVKGYTLQSWFLDLADVHTALYDGRGKQARAQIAAALHQFNQTPYWQVSQTRTTTWYAMGTAAVTAALQARSGSLERRRLLREASRYARKLDADRFPSAKPWAAMVSGGVAAITGDLDRAVRSLAAAERALEAVDMPLHAVIARRNRGVIIGGDTGRLLVRAADDDISKRGAVRPDRVAAMLGPDLSLL